MRNYKLPYPKDPSNILSELILNDKKHKRDKKEYLNSLMWAHYADSHKGICIKYRFDHSISHLGSENPSVVSYFKDVKYSNQDMREYSRKNFITMEDAFFLKGKYWEYENELRFLYFDLNGNSNYGNVPIKGCIEAVYFGLKCKEDYVKTIRNILKDKKLQIKDANGDVKVEKPIAFYKMQIDEKKYGQLKPVKLK